MRPKSNVGFWVMGVSALTVAGCSAARTPVAASAQGAPSSTCEAKHSLARPLGGPRVGSSVALAKVGAQTIAYVADEDAKAVIAIDVIARKEVGVTPLGGSPAQVLVAPDGRLFVTLRESSRLVVLEQETTNAPLARRCAVETRAEPVGIAMTPDDATVVVASGWGHGLEGFRADLVAKTFDVDLAREPRAVAIADDGKSAFVAHMVGSVLSVVDLTTPEHAVRPLAMRGTDIHQFEDVARVERQIERARRDPERLDLPRMEHSFDRLLQRGCQSFALAKSVEPNGRIYAPQVFVDPGDFEERTDGYGDGSGPSERPAVAVIDDSRRAPFPRSMVTTESVGSDDPRDEHTECLLPRSAAVDSATHTLLVGCFGIDSVIAYDALSTTPVMTEKRRFSVGAGPSGIAVDPEHHLAIVWSQFDRALDVIHLGSLGGLRDEARAPVPLPRKIALSPMAHPLPTDLALGRVLFHATGDARISEDGRACASCHPDGRDDAITWATPLGPRRSILLAGRVARTAPYSWTGDNTSIHEHLTHTFERLGGRGLRSLELDALVTYLSKMPAPPQGHIDERTRAKAARGRALFASAETGCSSCHSTNETFTDGRTHDVQSRHDADSNGTFNTPSLHLVGGTGPYFHDGRYTTLRQLLTESDGKMGNTKHLTELDLEALETYLRTL